MNGIRVRRSVEPAIETGAAGPPAKRVLVIRVGHLGDSVMATTVIEPLRSAFGEGVLIDFASGPGAAAEVLALDRRVHRVFPIRRRRLHWLVNNDKRRLKAGARGTPYDLVINLECGAICDDFARFLSYRQFLGRPFDRVEHSVTRHCVDTEKNIYRELLGAEETRQAEPAIRTVPQPAPAVIPPDSEYLLINPGFAGLTRRGYRAHRAWPLGYWAELIGLITEHIGCAVVVNGTAAEQRVLEPLLGLPQVRSLLGSALADLIEAIRQARCVVSVDTGTMHLAAALGRPVAALFGPTIPALTGPYSRSTPNVVLTSGVACQPCDRTPLKKRCRFNRCMSELTPPAVFSAVRRLLES